LGGFIEKHADIQLNIVTGLTFADFAAANTDVAVLYGDGNCPGYTTHRILNEQIIPVIAPEYYANPDIFSYEHLQMATRPTAWSDWLNEQTHEQTPQHLGPKFENFNMMIEGVRSGLGVAVLPVMYVEDDIRKGHLLTPFGPSITSRNGYYLACADHLSDSPKVAAFRDWLINTI
jgi:DNA-binding transcriptional LysR family regulator